MIRYTQGNLLEADAEALVNTVNTVGVMGKGVALMFKERFPMNMAAYAKACKAKELRTGSMFITETGELLGPKWIVNFPTKQHWRPPSKMEWIESGLQDLHEFIIDNDVQSIAIPPLGSGNGGLDWNKVKQKIESALNDLTDVDIQIYEPTLKYQNVAKRSGEMKLTPARALVAEMIRRYWILGMECSLLEIHKLAWFVEKTIERMNLENPLDLKFSAEKYGPYADRLRHLLNRLDGSYLSCDKRINDAGPLDVVWFNDSHNEYLQTYLASSEMSPFRGALEHTSKLVDGFESPFGLELLATVDWILTSDGYQTKRSDILPALRKWPAGEEAAQRKEKLFDARVIGIAYDRLTKQIEGLEVSI